MDEVSKARRKWKRAEDAVEQAQARLKAAGEKQGTDAPRAAAQVQRELEEAEDEERKAKRKYRRLRDNKGM
jgi:hypothetical protein